MAEWQHIVIEPPERLARLATVFAVELRMKIVVELYMREMSAKQFYEEFGGGTLSWVHQNFRILRDDGWLRFVRAEGPGGSRRGGEERLYRATEPPFIDPGSWALLPYSVRCTSSWNLFKVIAPRLRADLESTTPRDSPRRDLTCESVAFDAIGRKRVADAVIAQFLRLYQLQEDARRRAAETGEQLRRADVFLMSFEPAGGELLTFGDGLLVRAHREPNAEAFTARLAPILKDATQRQILWEMHRQELSVTQFHREFEPDTNRQKIVRRFRKLEEGIWIAKGRTVTGGSRRGAREQFFCATQPSLTEFDPCAKPPRSLHGTECWSIFQQLCDGARAAMLAGTFDAQLDRCVAWSLIRLDRDGWSALIAELEALNAFIYDEQRDAMQRMAMSGETPAAVTVGLGAFEALKETVRTH